MSEKKPTRQAEIVFAAMKAIEANGGEMRISDIYETLASSFPLTDYEKEETKSGVIRWKAYLNFYSIEVGKVGYLDLASDGRGCESSCRRSRRVLRRFSRQVFQDTERARGIGHRGECGSAR